MRRKIPFRMILIMGMSLILCAQTGFAEVTTQTIHLSTGWNLIAIQVALPDPSTAAFCDRFPGQEFLHQESVNRAADVGLLVQRAVPRRPR